MGKFHDFLLINVTRPIQNHLVNGSVFKHNLIHGENELDFHIASLAKRTAFQKSLHFRYTHVKAHPEDVPMDFFFLLLALVVVMKSADLAIQYAASIAQSFRLSKYVIGFLVVAIISILPETFIAISSSFQGIPEFGLGTLFGSNVADLTLVFAIIAFAATRSLPVQSTILKNQYAYIGGIAIPLILGLNGEYSRTDGAVLIVVGLLFYFLVLHKERAPSANIARQSLEHRHVVRLILSMAVLLVAANLTVRFGVSLAGDLGVNPILIGLLIVGIGTTLPELVFSIRAVRNRHDGLALGDILGTVMTDATIVVGLMALIRPFTFNARIIYITGVFMLLSTVVLFSLMRTGRTLSKREAVILLAFYVAFVTAEYLANTD